MAQWCCLVVRCKTYDGVDITMRACEGNFMGIILEY